MQHVDDGTIHAWLDRQVTDPAEVARIETHLRECPSCGARLADERETLEQADALLAAVAPAAGAGRPAFETIVAKAAGSGGAGSADSRSGFRKWLMPVSWAASVALAAALGWAVHDRAPLIVEPDRGARATSQAPAPQTTSPPAAQTQTQSGTTAPESSQRKAPDAFAAPNSNSSGTNESSQRQVAAAEAAADQPARAPEARAQSPRAEPTGENQRPTFRLNGALGESETGGGAVNIAPAPAAVQAAPAPAPAPAPPPPPQEVAFTFSAQANGADAVARAPEAGRAAPAPGAGAPAGGGGGGGSVAGGARGGGGGGGGRGGRGGAGGGRGGGAARAGDEADQGRIPVDGLAVAREAAAAADANAWQPLPRTDAAAQSGMALYGIEGLMPMATMLSADKSAVRTIYRLESGETIELVQQKAAVADRARAGAAGAASAATPAQGQLGQAQLGQGQGQGARPADPSPWTTVRDDVRLTLRGTVNLASLGERLRLD